MRNYLEALRKRGELRVVTREVDPRDQLAAIVRLSQQESDAPLLFERVRGTAFPVVSNVYGSHRRLCELIGTTPGNFCRRWQTIVEGAERPGAVRPALRSDDFPFEQGTLGALPGVQYCERDAGPYLTAGVFLAREPDTGVPNLSFSRAMMVSDTELRVRLAPPHDLARYQAKAEARDQALDVAILLGAPPEVFLGACASVPYEADEMAIANAIRGGAMPMRPCTRIDLMVPAETEIVIEGRILPRERRPEGPFGEFLGYYVEQGPNHVFEVLNVTWRPGALFHALLCGYAEDLRALEISFSGRAFRHLAATLPGILDVSCCPSPMQTIVRIEPQYEGHARQVILAAMGSHLQYNKIVIVVDEDVNIHDFEDVWWAVVTRCRVDRHVMTIPDVPGFHRDPAGVFRGRLGIDATRPRGREKEFERKRVRGVESINLRDFLPR
ncbi:MAG: UbiD family decarboxylase [Steroidobacteraceae bacterium]